MLKNLFLKLFLQSNSKKMFKINILYFLIPFLILGCNDKSLIEWEVLNSNETNLKDQGEEFEKLLIYNNDYFLIGQDVKSNNWQDFKAITYQSKNSGRVWKKVINDEGVFLDGYINNEFLNLIAQKYSDNSFKNCETKLSVYNRLNYNKIGDKIICKRDSSIVRVFNDGNKSYALINKGYIANKNSIFNSKNDFKTYKNVEINKPLKKIVFFNDKIYFLTSEYFVEDYETIEKNKLFILNKKSLDSIETKDVVEDFCVDKNGIYLLSKINEKIIVNYIDTKKQKNNTLKVVNEKELEPKMIYKYNNFVAVLVNSINVKGLGGFGSVAYKLYVSLDNGETFKEENLPIDNYVKPIEFYKDKSIIFYAGAGRICRGTVKKY